MKSYCPPIARTLLYTGSLLFFSPSLFAQKIASGDHGLSICKDSTVRAWGINNSGELGNGTVDTLGGCYCKVSPVEITGLTGIIAVGGGSGHSIALKSDGTVWSWGGNNNGQLGDGTRDSIGCSCKSSPVPVSGLTNVTAIAALSFHSLAVKNDGSVWAWGANPWGELGDGTTTERHAPVQVSGLTNVRAVAAGYTHSLALKNDSTVWAWGDNQYGELGDGTVSQRLTPVQVVGLTGVSAIAGNHMSSIALKADGTVWTWGDNGFGQLGDSTFSGSIVPIQVTRLAGVVAIGAGEYHFIAEKADGTVWAWGGNGYGQVGVGTTDFQIIPAQVVGLTNVTDLAGGSLHSLARKTDGTVWAWGHNGYGELADGTLTDKWTPVPVTGLCQNTVTGVCFIDINQNGKQDAGEPGYTKLSVVTTGSTYTSASQPDVLGFYSNNTDSGSATTAVLNAQYYTASPLQHTSNFSAYSLTDTVNFALTPIANIQDLRITLIPLAWARAGRDVGYQVVYENTGTKTMSGNLYLVKDPKMTFVSAIPAYTPLSTDSVMWTYSNLLPNESRSISVIMNVSSSTLPGDDLFTNAIIEPAATDSTPSDNTSAIQQVVFSSFDPNDKTVLQGDKITTLQVAKGDYLDYLIRFQNTGNDTAFVIVVRDTLDSKLDWNTFEMISASNNYSLTIRDHKNLSWTLNNVLLPDSNIDEANSHGYLCYRIKPKNSLTAGEVISNTAYIYFDYNTPVITNTATTTVVFPTVINGLKNGTSDLILYPNPANDMIYVTGNSLQGKAVTINIFNALGEILISNYQLHGKEKIETDISNLPAGVYIIQVNNGETKLRNRFIKE